MYHLLEHKQLCILSTEYTHTHKHIFHVVLTRAAIISVRNINRFMFVNVTGGCLLRGKKGVSVL